MELLKKLKSDLRESLIQRDARKASALRMVLSSVKNFEIEKKAPSTDAEIISIIRSEIKKIKDSIYEFSKAGREDLVQKEKNDLEILVKYVPVQISEEATRKLVKEIIQEAQPDARNFGKIMGLIMQKYKNEVDGNTVSRIVKEELKS